MKLPLFGKVVLVVLVILGIGYEIAAEKVAGIAARAMIQPPRRAITQSTPNDAKEETYSGVGVTLKGWLFPAKGPRRGTLVYLHGIADNRAGVIGLAAFFTLRGFDVLAYDSRAHGQSTGDMCTFGWWEKQDLHRVIDTLPPGEIVLIGTSLGAAIALQEAADDRRISAVVAAETFSDLRTVATERAPGYLNTDIIEKAFRIAGNLGKFNVDAASPLLAAARITAPVLIIHGANDVDTPPTHSRKVFAALHCPKEFILVPNAWHNGSLRELGWPKVAEWIDGLNLQ